jgi:hypothetical protein
MKTAGGGAYCWNLPTRTDINLAPSDDIDYQDPYCENTQKVKIRHHRNQSTVLVILNKRQQKNTGEWQSSVNRKQQHGFCKIELNTAEAVRVCI